MRRRNAALELTLAVVAVLAVLLAALTWITLRWQRAWLETIRPRPASSAR